MFDTATGVINIHATHQAQYNRTEDNLDWYLCECGAEISEDAVCGG